MTDLAALPLPVRDALETMRRHPAVSSVQLVSHSSEATVVEAQFSTDLPSRWRAAGESPTGVRPVEPVFLTFRPDYPSFAPAIRLRRDFNRFLPHINPHDEGDFVPPCVVFGGTTEFLHREGLGALLNQTAVWLRKAARGELIDPAQGWEPVRRDEVVDQLVFDPARIAALVIEKARHAYLIARFAALYPEGGPPGLMVGLLKHDPVRVNAAMVKELFKGSLNGGMLAAETLAVVCWPGKAPSGGSFVRDQYLPETVTTYGGLLARADAYGCGQPLRDAVSWLRKASSAEKRKLTYPLLFILCARRPLNVIGTTSPIELLAYRCDVRFPGLMVDDDATPVRPVAHCHPVSQSLLRRMSGLAVDLVTPGTTMLGCGSLGSKVAAHLARAGLPPRALIDRGIFRPHNGARHALFPEGAVESALPRSKALALATALGGLGDSAPAHLDGDVLCMAPGTDEFARMFPRDLTMVVNTTASHAVRDHLGALGEALPGRVAEGALADDGRLALLTLEGPGRNPDTADLTTAAYEQLRTKGRLASLAGLSTLTAARVSVGVGCDTVTLVMSDARLSMHAAAIGEQLTRWLADGLPGEGALLIGLLGEDGISSAWQRAAIGPTHSVPAENEATWTVRILDRAHRRIMEDIARWPRVETGGVIVGRVSPVRRVIHITDVIDAPPDSRRSAGAFVLGTAGLSEAVGAYEKAGAGALWCLGTWHSHLADQGGSPRDYATATILEGRSRAAVVMLIRRSTGYSAIVKPGA